MAEPGSRPGRRRGDTGPRLDLAGAVTWSSVNPVIVGPQRNWILTAWIDAAVA
jgi:hypothetical protein